MSPQPTDFWIHITDTAWWQVILTLLTAFTVAAFTHIFLERRTKRKIIRETAARMMTAGRTYRSTFVGFIENDLDFVLQQKHMNKRRDDDKLFDVYKEASFWSQKTALNFREQSERSRMEFLEAGYLLTAMLNKSMAKDTSFTNAINGVMRLSKSALEDKDFTEAKAVIDKQLLPHLDVIEATCHKIIYDHSRLF